MQKQTYQEILVERVNKNLSIASVIALLCDNKSIVWHNNGVTGEIGNVFPYDEKSGFSQDEWAKLRVIVNKTYNTAICYETGLGGLPVRFASDYNVCSPFQAAEKLLPQLQTSRDELKELATDKATDIAVKWRLDRTDIFEAVHQVLMREYWRNEEAQAFALKRGWDEEISRTFELGYHAKGVILKAAADYEWSLEDLANAGFLYSVEKDGETIYTEKYAYRVSYPIRNADGRLVAFSFRDVGKNEEDWIKKHGGGHYPKKCLFMGSEACIEPSSEQLYGIHIAKRHISAANPNIYMVEGQPDCMAMWAAGFPNTVAIMTAYVSEEITSEKFTHDEFGKRDGIQVDIISEGKLKGLIDIGVKKITFIPDIDKYDENAEPFGAGIRACLVNIERAKKVTYTSYNEKVNLEVDVVELPVKAGSKEDAAAKACSMKQDADSFFAEFDSKEKRHEAFLKEKPQNFAIWWAKQAQKAITFNSSPEERQKWIERAVRMLANIQVKNVRDLATDDIVKNCKGFQKNLITGSLKAELGRRKNEANKKEQSFKGDMTIYGFREQPDELSGGRVYYMQDKEEPFTDFTIAPHYCIKDLTNKTVWVCEMTGENGNKEVMTIDNDDITSASRFKSLCAKAAMSFEGKEPELNKLFRFIKNNSLPIVRITRMGWQSAHDIWVWGNGVFENGTFIPANKFGVCDISRDRHIYIAAARELGEMDEDGDQFQFEHDFSYIDETAGGFNKVSRPSLQRVFQDAYTLWGDNGKILLMWAVSLFFYDIVVRYGQNFPIFVGYGPKGSGKSASAKFVTSFFSTSDCCRQVLGSTKAALDSIVKHTSCAVVHWDEYTEAIGRDPEKVDMIKGAWDGYTRAKMNAKTDFSTAISTKVKSGIMITGQVFPNSDASMLRRYVLCEYYDDKETFNTEENIRVFNELANWEKAGFQHLTHQMLAYREDMARDYQGMYDTISKRMQLDLEKTPNIVPSIRDNYVAILTTQFVLSREEWWPFNFAEAYDICLERIKWQSKLSESKDERAAFWNALSMAANRFVIIRGVHYKIKYSDRISKKERNREQIQKKTLRVLLLRFDDAYITLKKFVRADDETSKKLMDRQSMWHYVEKQSCICDVTEETFYDVDEQNNLHRRSDGSLVPAKRFRCKAFDYEKLLQEYPGLTLHEMENVVDLDENNELSDARTDTPSGVGAGGGPQENELPF